ncbi:MAG: hypothetical protein HZA01_10050 [Nitrospinae bacterium]|nr:hypothetical protein [Nitrospinota bacterium]
MRKTGIRHQVSGGRGQGKTEGERLKAEDGGRRTEDGGQRRAVHGAWNIY